MTEARTIPPIREGLARALFEAEPYRIAGAYEAQRQLYRDQYLALADAAISYLRSRHLLNDIALSNIKDEEAPRAGEGV